MTEEENAAYDDLVDEVDKLNDRVRDLLIERNALQAQNAAMRELVQAVADAGVYHDSKGGWLIVDQPFALINEARAILAEK